jgi:hypothetical protein
MTSTIQSIPAIHLTPAQLDQQCQVSIHEWLDINSDKARQLDEYYFCTKRWLRFGVEGGVMFIDKLGRVFGKGKDGYYPYHFEYKNKLYGYRIAVRAAN